MYTMVFPHLYRMIPSLKLMDYLHIQVDKPGITITYIVACCETIMVKSSNFGHQVNSDIHMQKVEIQMRRLLMSRLIRIFTFSFYIPMI